MRLTCFGGPFDFASDEEGLNSPGGGLRIGYCIVPKSSWMNLYIVREVPKNRPSAVLNPNLKFGLIRNNVSGYGPIQMGLLPI